ncbi:hypothetical protein MHY87_18010 [Microvirga sp. ACRRW]|uniref:hypothetical protein n=1 Tax=Microvirga sp. ACRRW TaxID=2918205 RepID=UPI001EF5C445|nr:hypothetical protein [Microvirga sp. ACRRW]MCG7394797.1 hypothetical protein [Microvirga sp. ACRRW]
MKRLAAAVGVALSTAGCVSTSQETVTAACSEFIGRPISERIAALGPPRATYRISPTEIGYVYETKETVFVGGHPYYTVNYLVGADKHRTPIRPVTTKCRGFVVSAPSAATPVSERIIVDVL